MFISAYVTYVILIPINQSHPCGHKILLNVSYILKVDKAHNTTIITFTELIKVVRILHVYIKGYTFRRYGDVPLRSLFKKRLAGALRALSVVNRWPPTGSSFRVCLSCSPAPPRAHTY